MYIVFIFDIELVVYFNIMCNGGTQIEEGKVEHYYSQLDHKDMNNMCKEDNWTLLQATSGEIQICLKQKEPTLVIQKIDSEGRSRNLQDREPNR